MHSSVFLGNRIVYDYHKFIVVLMEKKRKHIRKSSDTKFFHSTLQRCWNRQQIGEVIHHLPITLRFIATGLLLDTRLRKSLPQDLKDFFHLYILDPEQHHSMVQQISHLRSCTRLVLVLEQRLNQFTSFFTGLYAKIAALTLIENYIGILINRKVGKGRTKHGSKKRKSMKCA